MNKKIEDNLHSFPKNQKISDEKKQEFVLLLDEISSQAEGGKVRGGRLLQNSYLIFTSVLALLLFSFLVYTTLLSEDPKSENMYQEIYGSLPESDIGDISKKVQFEMVLDKSIYNSEVQEMSLAIINKSDKTLFTGSSYQFEVLINDTWYQLPYKSNTFWTLEEIMIKPNNSFTQDIWLYRLKNELASGRYRIIKHFEVNVGLMQHISDKKKELKEENIILSAEFEVK
jgi:hypothetical protein